MLTIGIDQSFTNTGVCVLDDANMIHYELISTDKTLDDFERAEAVAEALVKIVKNYQPNRVYYESLAYSSFGDATRKLAGLLFIIVTRLRTVFPKEQILEIAPTSLKKFATGSGKAKKEELYDCLPDNIREVFSEVKKTKGRYDLTDAYWLARHGCD